MLAIVSPAKQLDFSDLARPPPHIKSAFTADTRP